MAHCSEIINASLLTCQITSFWRNIGVVIASCARWEFVKTGRNRPDCSSIGSIPSFGTKYHLKRQPLSSKFNAFYQFRCVSALWTTLYCTLSISRGIISPKNTEKTPHSSPVRTRYGWLLWVHSLNEVVAFFFSYCGQNRVIIDHDISRDCVIMLKTVYISKKSTTQVSLPRPHELRDPQVVDGYDPIVCSPALNERLDQTWHFV